MHTSSRRSRRHVIGTAALGALLTLSPVLTAAPAVAKAPATAVTGLARGDRGESVRTVQQALVNQGVAVDGGVDGVFGPGTEAAVKAFQGAQGLPQSGTIDDATALALGLASSPLLGLTQGARGEAVVQLQERLTAAGHRPNGGADGIFGAGTSAAVEAFQSAEGLSATGRVDAATAAALGAVSVGTTAGGSAATADAPAARGASGAVSSTALVGLKIGSRGEAVKLLQQTIMKAGFTVVGGADGIFGVLTANALTSFQNANGLDTTGVVDEATAKVLATVAGGAGGGGGGAHDPTVSSPLLGLRYGSIGSDVKALQQALIDAGIKVHGGADGVFGTATRDALEQYQRAKGLDVSGVVDEATASALASRGSASPGSSALVGLKAGALGNTVKQLQQALIDAGITVRGGADGIFGPATAGAVKEFQRQQGLPATGEVDQKTAAALADPKPAGAKNPDGGGTAGYAQYGEKGQRVLALQSALVAAGIDVRGGVDGDFGGGTSAAVMELQRRKGLPVTGKVDDATAAALGLAKMDAPTAPDPSKVKLAAFPVQGRCGFADTWLFSRGGGRQHLGVDIIAAEGKLIYAVADGKIEKVYADYPGSLSGNGVRLRMADGTYFFYAHMQQVADGIDVGVPVKAGQIIGYVGSTGNSGTPHLHFEIHPQGGAAVNPYPFVKAIDACDRTKPLPQP